MKLDVTAFVWKVRCPWVLLILLHEHDEITPAYCYEYYEYENVNMNVDTIYNREFKLST